jgi:hypothetical protein
MARLSSRLARFPDSAADLKAAHDVALATAAYGDAADAAASRVLLGTIARRVAALPAAQRHRLDDTGLAGTEVRTTFAWPVAAWLGKHAPGHADIDWPRVGDPARLDPLLRGLVLRAEEDEFDSGDIGTREWLRLAEGGRADGDLAWLTSAVVSRGRSRAWDALWDALEVPVRWRLNGSPWSASALTAPWHAARGSAAALPKRRPPVDAPAHMATPLRGIRRAKPKEAQAWLDTAVAALASRAREVHAITHANLDEVWLAPLGADTTLAVIGIAPAWRLSLEANYGWLATVRGIPVAYGGVSPLGAQANTGIHVFDAFRGREAAWLWAETLRAFATLFGVRRFVVNPVQIGEDNDDAIASGAFWFYWRLGFRPVLARIADEAAHDAARRAAHPRYRTPPARLTRFAQADLALTLPGAPRHAAFDERALVAAAHGVTTRLAAGESRWRALAEGQASVATLLGAPGRRRWSSDEVRAFERMAPVVSLVAPAIARWPISRRRALLAMMQAKGAPQERTYVRAMQRVPAFWQALAAWSRAHPPQE